MSWHKISYDKQNGGYGTYILKMEPNAKSLHHIHTGYEEFLMLEGELTDLDGKIFKKGDFVTFEPGSTHSSHTKEGCLILVFMRGINKPL
jgi:anti-sigma factor ChrR (cupin superfamily)